MPDLIPSISWPGGSLENSGIIAGIIVGAYLGALWLAALIWTIRDVRDRSADPITQIVAFLIVFIFNLPGWVLYQVVRPPMTLADVYERQLEEEALRRELDDALACPSCAREIADDYITCPYCAMTLKHPCSSCERAVSFSWLACPWCGTRRDQPAVQKDAVPPARDDAADELSELVTKPVAAREIRPAPRPAPAPWETGGEEPPSPFRHARSSDRGEPARIAAAD